MIIMIIEIFNQVVSIEKAARSRNSVVTPWPQEKVVFRSRYSEDVVLAMLQHRLIPGDDQLETWIFLANRRENRPHRCSLLGWQRIEKCFGCVHPTR